MCLTYSTRLQIAKSVQLGFTVTLKGLMKQQEHALEVTTVHWALVIVTHLPAPKDTTEMVPRRNHSRTAHLAPLVRTAQRRDLQIPSNVLLDTSVS